MINPIARERLRRNLLQTSVKVLAIGIEVTIILSWAGIHHGIGPNPSVIRLIFAFYVSILLLFALLVSFLLVAIGRYSEVLEMNQEIGILRVLGASGGYILGLLYQETLLVTVLGTIAGIIMTFGAKWFVAIAFPKFMTLDTMYKWWPIAGAISASGSLLGTSFALTRSVTQGLIHALSPEE